MNSPFARTKCACAECVACCKRQPGPLAPGDFERIADHLGESPAEAERHFCASPGAIIRTLDGRIARVGTITPRFEDGRCVFLGPDDRCTIHAVAPFGCSHFDVHMTADEANPRSLWAVRQQMTKEYQQLRDRLEPATHYNPRRRT
jgi:Fe-S-cluster containining protein